MCKDEICFNTTTPVTQALPFVLFCNISIQMAGQSQRKRTGLPHVATWWSSRSREPLLMYSVTMQKNSGSLQMPKIWMMWLNLALWSTSASFSRQFLSLKRRRLAKDQFQLWHKCKNYQFHTVASAIWKQGHWKGMRTENCHLQHSHHQSSSLSSSHFISIDALPHGIHRLSLGQNVVIDVFSQHASHNTPLTADVGHRCVPVPKNPTPNLHLTMHIHSEIQMVALYTTILLLSSWLYHVYIL